MEGTERVIECSVDLDHRQVLLTVIVDLPSALPKQTLASALIGQLGS